jgi:hypothetical protein
MVVRLLPYFFLLCGALLGCVSGNVVHLDQYLNDLLGRVDVPFSVQNISAGSLGYVDVSGECKNITLHAIDARNTNFSLGLNVSGLGLSCDAHVLFRFPPDQQPEPGVDSLDMHIDFLLDNGWLNFPFSVPPTVLDPSNPSLLLPSNLEVDVDQCTGQLPGTHNITGSPADVADVFSIMIENSLTDPKTFCGVVAGVLNKYAPTIFMSLDYIIFNSIDDAQKDKGLPEATFNDTNGDIANISNNIGTTYLKDLLNTLGDPANPENINKVLQENGGDSFSYGVDNDPTADVTCPNDPGKKCPLFPVSLFEGTISNYTVGLNITGLSVAGLDTVSQMGLQTPGPSLNVLDFALGWEDLAVKVNVSARVIKAGASDELLEHFSMDLGLKNFGLGASGFLHFNGTTADQFTFLQLPHPGCLSQAVNSTQAGLMHANMSLPSFEFAITPAGQPDGMERGLDNTVYALTQLIFNKYAVSVDGLANWALAIPARHKINSLLDEYLARNVTDEDDEPHNDTRVCLPAKPAYQSAFLHNAGLYGAIAATAVGVILLVTAAFAKKQLSDKVKQTPPPSAPDAAAPLTAGAQDPSLDDDADDFGDSGSLARNPKLPIGLRAGLPILVFANVILFISSNAGSGASIYVDLSAGGTPLFPGLPPAFDFSLVNTIVEMAQGKVWLLVFVIGFFSGVWPYVKLGMMLACWFIPANKLSIPRRHKLLEFLDAFGKWSLVDTYVLVLFVVAFSINMECSTAPSQTFSQICNAAGVGDAVFKLYVLPTIGFHTFLIATLMSLVNGLAMSSCHRYVHRIGEFGPAEDYERVEGLGNKRRLCSVLKDNSKFSSVGVTLGLVVSMVFAVLGVFLTTFEFVFQGVAGLALGDAKTRAYSLFGLGEELPGASINPNTFGIHWIQFFFIVFSGVTVLIFLGLLLVLWNAPLTVKGQRTFLVMAQVMNAWSGLDVFVVSILACVLEISQFADFIITDTGLQALNPYLPFIFSFFPDWNQQLQESGGANVFTLSTELKPGFWLLAVAAILSTGIGQMTLSKCSRSLFDANHQPLTDSIAASFTNTDANTVSGP